MNFLRQVKQSISRIYGNINRYPMEAIEMVVVATLAILSLYAFIPIELLPAGSTSAYANNIGKAIAGTLMIYPAIRLLYLRISRGVNEYILLQRKRRNLILAVGTIWLYLGILRSISQPWYPPHHILFISIGLVTVVLYVRLGK